MFSQDNSYKMDESLIGSSPHIKSIDLNFVKQYGEVASKPSLGTSPEDIEIQMKYKEFSKILESAPPVLTEYI